MPTFDQVSLQEAMLKTAGKRAQTTQEYLGYIEQLTEGQAGRLQPGEGESMATVRRRLGVAAKLSGKDITIKRQGNEVYFWVQQEPRPRADSRRLRPKALGWLLRKLDLAAGSRERELPPTLRQVRF